jgi:hypothetical protein
MQLLRIYGRDLAGRTGGHWGKEQARQVNSGPYLQTKTHDSLQGRSC